MEHIFDGTKRFEFRKSRCKKPAESIIIYCTAPVKMVVGEARIVRILEDSPDKIWDEAGSGAGISKSYYDAYYDGRERAVAYELGDVTEYPVPISLSKLGVTSAPQSFMYIDRAGVIPRIAYPG